jgi:two-component system sensor histidine kinase YesM
MNWIAIAQLKGPNEISKMIQLLSKILKYSMRISENSGVPLDEEIEHTRYYLEIQNIRFAGRFSAEWDIDSSLGDFQVPRLIFQPVLENCFTHGFKDDTQPLKITIKVFREADRTIIIIEDNGEGIDPKTLEQLNENNPNIAEKDSFVGFINIRKRINFFYKGNAEILITSKKTMGTTIRISVPEGNSGFPA